MEATISDPWSTLNKYTHSKKFGFMFILHVDAGLLSLTILRPFSTKHNPWSFSLSTVDDSFTTSIACAMDTVFP